MAWEFPSIPVSSERKYSPGRVLSTNSSSSTGWRGLTSDVSSGVLLQYASQFASDCGNYSDMRHELKMSLQSRGVSNYYWSALGSRLSISGSLLSR